ncbi:MAG: zinc dependent phospholipase C family protein [Thermoplasmata archaeon]
MSFVFEFALCAVPYNVHAWSNGGYSSDPQNPDYGTHDWIAEMALTIQTKDVTFLSVTYHSKYLLGTEAPDNPAYIGDSINHHIYYYSNGNIQDDKSADRAYDMYQAALGYLKGNDKEMAAYHIGAMSHYISDVGVFGHTMGSGTDWGSEAHHSDYESAFESLIGSLELPSGIPLEDLSAYDAALGLAKDITFGKGDIKPNVWMDSNYQWTSPVFEASAMASIYAAVRAVAAAINHLLIEYSSSTNPPEPPPQPPTPPPIVPPQVRAPGSPRSLNATLEGSKVLITWLPPLDDGGTAIISYYIYRGNSRDNFIQKSIVEGNILSWIDSDVKEGETYYYKVQARNAAGFGNFSIITSIAIPVSNGAPIQDPLSPLQLALPSAAVAAIVGGVLFLLRKKKNQIKP